MSVGNVTVAGNVMGSPTGARSFGPLTITALSAVDQTSVLSLSSGNNTVTVPSGATAAVIVGPNGTIPTPNPLSSATLTVKGVGGDTGIVVSSKWPTLLTFDTTPATFVINASGSCTVEIWYM